MFLQSDLSFCKSGFDQAFGLADFGSTRFRTTDRLNRIPVLNEPRVHLNEHRARSKVVSVEDSRLVIADSSGFHGKIWVLVEHMVKTRFGCLLGMQLVQTKLYMGSIDLRWFNEQGLVPRWLGKSDWFRSGLEWSYMDCLEAIHLNPLQPVSYLATSLSSD